MRLLHSSDVDVGPGDRVYRHARVPALVLWLAAFCGDATMFFIAFTGKWKPGYIFGPAALLFLLLLLKFVTARFHSSNWLVRANRIGLFAQYRSYLNYELASDEASVVFIPYSEIASAHLIRERVRTPDPMHSGATQTRYLRYIELKLAGDTATLAEALQSELSKRPQMKQRWYGSSSTLYRDYPLSMNSAPFLRIRWDVTPGASRFLSYLSAYTSIADPIVLTTQFTHLQSLSHEEQQNQLRDLVVRGESIAAIYLAQRLYGSSLAQAHAMVDGLTASDK